MPWCPKCKSEYVEGIKECKKCHCELVEDLEKAMEIIAVGPKEQLENIIAIFKNNGVESAKLAYQEEDKKFAIKIFPSDKPAAVKCIEDMNRMRNQMQFREMSRSKAQKGEGASELYQNKAEQAEEVKSSAYALIIVGFAGLLIIALFAFGIIPINMNLFTKTVTFSVMGLLFVCLIVMGFLSVKSFHNLLDFAKEEDKLTDEIEKWYQKELSREMIDAGLFGNDENAFSEEEKYFARIERIKALLDNKFMNLKPAYSDNMTETIYQELFENED